MEQESVDVEQAKDKEHLFRRYGSILGTSILPISILAVRYFERNYGKILRSIPGNSRILEIGSGSASFTQYLLYKGYKDITICEIADDNAESVKRFFKDRVKVVHKDVTRYLGASSDTFDVIFAAQLIEHFTYDEFISFLERCYASLDRNGHIVLETINCANITHGSYLRYCDYTHRMGFTPRSLKQFLMAVGDFSDIKLMEIHPPGLLDLLYCARRRISGKSTVGLSDSHCSDGSSRTRRESWKAMTILLKSLNIWLSRRLSFVLLRPYEFDKIRVYTPFFAVVARKA